MQYMLMYFESETEIAKREDPAAAPAYWGAWQSYIGAMQQAGIVVNGDGLYAPHTATRVSMSEGKRFVQDGPLPDAKEHLGGYFIVEVPHLDAAMQWAAKSPNMTNGYTEIRPVMPPPKR
jgi:hypothetical protein